MKKLIFGTLLFLSSCEPYRINECKVAGEEICNTLLTDFKGVVDNDKFMRSMKFCNMRCYMNCTLPNQKFSMGELYLDMRNIPTEASQLFDMPKNPTGRLPTEEELFGTVGK